MTQIRKHQVAEVACLTVLQLDNMVNRGNYTPLNARDDWGEIRKWEVFDAYRVAIFAAIWKLCGVPPSRVKPATETLFDQAIDDWLEGHFPELGYRLYFDSESWICEPLDVTFEPGPNAWIMIELDQVLEETRQKLSLMLD